jgi:hypothetical protein
VQTHNAWVGFSVATAMREAGRMPDDIAGALDRLLGKSSRYSHYIFPASIEAIKPIKEG